MFCHRASCVCLSQLSLALESQQTKAISAALRRRRTCRVLSPWKTDLLYEPRAQKSSSHPLVRADRKETSCHPPRRQALCPPASDRVYPPK